MTQQPFDPMDKLLREALESDALPPADLTDRIMAQVAATPQNAARRKKNPYWKWMVSAAACLVVAAAAIPLALNSRSRQDAMSDMATADAAVDDSREEDMVTSAVPGSDACDMQENRVGEAAKQDSAHDQPYDPMDTALDSAARLLHQQGYVLEVTVRGDTAVQVTASDGRRRLHRLRRLVCTDTGGKPVKLRTRQLTLAALTAAAYAVLSYFGSIFGITYGPIQCRFSEALCVLPFFLPETAWGLGVGCLIANLLSPYGVLDIVVGSAATLLAALLTARCKKMWLAPLPPVLANTVLIGLVLAYEQAGTSAAFWPTYGFNALTVGLGEVVACYGLGMLLLWRLSKSTALQNYLKNR